MDTPKKWYNTIWFAVAMLLLGILAGWLLKTYCYLGGESCLHF